MSQFYPTDEDPVAQSIEVTIAGCLMRIETTRSGVMLLNGARVEAFEPHAQLDRTISPLAGSGLTP